MVFSGWIQVSNERVSFYLYLVRTDQQYQLQTIGITCVMIVVSIGYGITFFYLGDVSIIVGNVVYHLQYSNWILIVLIFSSAF